MIFINWKAEIFHTELESIHSEELKKFAEEAIGKLPDYFFEVAASSTGKYHPSYAIGPGGLVRHTKAAVNIASDLLNLEQNQAAFSEKERDCMLIALMLHDGWKHGEKKNRYTVAKHPVVCAEWLRSESFDHSIDAGALNLIADAISTHMGQWNTEYGSGVEIMDKPKTEVQKFVHMCDYLASRKYLTYEFGNDFYSPDNMKIKTNKDKSDDLKTKIAELIKLCKEKISSGIDRELLYSVISEYNGGKRNPNTITDSDVADQIVAEIKEKWHE